MPSRYMILLMFVLSVPAMNGCGDAGSELRIAFCSDLQGYLLDCGCPGSPAGGLARRVAYIERVGGSLDNPRLLHVDPGGFSNFYTELGPAKTATIIDLYDRMHLDAVNVTARELADSADRFFGLINGCKTPYISANIVDVATGEPVFPSHVILPAGEHNVAVIGVTQRVLKTWELADGRVLATSDPEEVLPPLVEGLRQKADAVILLAHIPRVRLKGLLEAAPGIDMVIGGDGYSLTHENQEIAGVPISYAGHQGQALGYLRCRFTEEGVEVTEQSVKRLTTDLPEDAGIRKLVDQALEEMERETASVRSGSEGNK